MAKIIRKNYTLSGLLNNGVVQIQAPVEQNYEELIVKQLVLGNAAGAQTKPFKVWSGDLAVSFGSVMQFATAKPDVQISIVGKTLPSLWTFEVRDHVNANLNNEGVSIDIELSKVDK